MLLCTCADAATVTLHPGDDIQAAVDLHEPGTTFRLEAGIYRLQSVRPKDGDTFQGERRAILCGARSLTGFARQGSYWVVGGQAQQGPAHTDPTACEAGYPRCTYPEDLFFDDKPLRHVARFQDLMPGGWFFDYDAHKIYLGQNPAGHRIETSVVTSAFYGLAARVTIQGLVVEKYASPAQVGAIGGSDHGPGWVIRDNEVRWNHGQGIMAVKGDKVVGNYVHDNGQAGVEGFGNEILVEGNEIAFNNYAGFNCGWECGGAKFSVTDRLVIRNNKVHDNNGPGLWTDTNNIRTLYEGNLVINNRHSGIVHEVSYDAIIRGNTLRGNGRGYFVWLWGGQIVIQNSQNVEVANNTVQVPADGGNGITLVKQERREGGKVYVTSHNYVHDNDVIYTGSQGLTGAESDDGTTNIYISNRFDHNRYHIIDKNAAQWTWRGKILTWEGFRGQGQELHGTLDISSR